MNQMKKPNNKFINQMIILGLEFSEDKQEAEVVILDLVITTRERMSKQIRGIIISKIDLEMRIHRNNKKR
jgi:hypothetical protein